MPDFNPGETLFCGLELLSGLLENSQAAAGQELGESGGGNHTKYRGFGQDRVFCYFPWLFFLLSPPIESGHKLVAKCT
jgi:hypothetical protein